MLGQPPALHGLPLERACAGSRPSPAPGEVPARVQRPRRGRVRGAPVRHCRRLWRGRFAGDRPCSAAGKRWAQSEAKGFLLHPPGVPEGLPSPSAPASGIGGPPARSRRAPVRASTGEITFSATSDARRGMIEQNPQSSDKRAEFPNSSARGRPVQHSSHEYPVHQDQDHADSRRRGRREQSSVRAATAGCLD